MLKTNRFGEVVHEVQFNTFDEARRFARMIGANTKCFSLLGVRLQQQIWVVRYRSRQTSPWARPAGCEEVR